MTQSADDIRAAKDRFLANRACRLGIDDLKSPYHSSQHGGDEDVALDLFERDCATLIDAYIASPWVDGPKPLEWRQAVLGEMAVSGQVLYQVMELSSPHYAIPCVGLAACDSIDHGKQLCQEHREAELLKEFTR